MLTYRTAAIANRAGGKAMATYLLAETVPHAVEEIAAYYAERGQQTDLDHLGRAVASGEMLFSDALDGLMREALRTNPEADEAGLYRIEDLLAARLADASLRAERGDASPTAAEPRLDMHPRVAEQLAIDPSRSVSSEELTHLLGGRRADGQEITGAAKGREIAFTDLTWSADKSVSLAWAFAPTDAERREIHDAHTDAVRAAMSYVATDLGSARRGHGGRGGAEAGELAWVSFHHYTARPTLELPVGDHTELVPLPIAGDPQLHTHVALLNVVSTESGHVGSIDLNRLEGRVHQFGAYYQAHLAQNLRSRGVDVVLDEETGAARLTAIPQHVREAFSKRGQTAEAIARQWAADEGKDYDTMDHADRFRLVHRAAIRSRHSKAADHDQAAWQAQAKQLNWQHVGATNAARADAYRPLQHADRINTAYNAALPFVEKRLNGAAVMGMDELRASATRGLIASGLDGPADILHVVSEMSSRGVRQEGKTTTLIAGRYGSKVRVTTEAHVGREEDIVALAKAAAADRSAALSPKAIAAALARSPLTFSDRHGQQQRQIVERLGSGGRLSVAIGIAGSGKTQLLAPLVDAWTRDGRTVIGAAVAWRQTDDLELAGIHAARRFALSVLLDRAGEGKVVIDRNTVIVLDELGVVGAPDMRRLLRLQAKTGAQVVAIGDPLQCQSIEAGPVIDLMRRALGRDQLPELLSTVRQETARERETTMMFREGRAAEALARKEADGSLRIVPGSYQAAVEHVADLWAERRRAHVADPSYKLTISAPTNADARAIGAAIRERRRADGEIGRDQVTAMAVDQTGAQYGLPLAVGDRVRLFANTSATTKAGRRVTLGRNGSVVEILGIERAGLVMRNAAGTTGRVSWATLADRENGRARLTYGDALTIAATQGLTATEHIDAMPGGTQAANAFSSYVAESRHRRRSYLVTSDGAERREIAERRPMGDPQPIERADVIANMARNLERRPSKPSALEFLEAAAQHLRVAARGLRDDLRGDVPRPSLKERFAQSAMVRTAAAYVADRMSVSRETAQPRARM